MTTATLVRLLLLEDHREFFVEPLVELCLFFWFNDLECSAVTFLFYLQVITKESLLAAQV